ncbi:hypothetical protein CC2G_004256 [Coprinopsis cinerea AmutBmut pab1-1]|nr:hypothetical protein CC2G_004256 [Coprinopsis cinerea AmutBmut pab1-1]
MNNGSGRCSPKRTSSKGSSRPIKCALCAVRNLQTSMSPRITTRFCLSRKTSSKSVFIDKLVILRRRLQPTPIDTLPTLKSHIHPKFAITHLGAALRDLAHSSLERYLKLKEQHPILYTIRMLCWRWSILPDRATEDPTYVVPQASSALDEDGEEDDLPNSESGDSVETVPRRVEYVFDEDEKRELRRREERSAARRAAQLRKRRLSIDDTYPDECPARGEGPVRTVEGGVLKHSKVDADGWTPDTISAWAQRCTGGPEDHSIPTSPPILRPRLENMESSGAPATS